jgi:hypothetical protein
MPYVLLIFRNKRITRAPKACRDFSAKSQAADWSGICPAWRNTRHNARRNMAKRSP